MKKKNNCKKQQAVFSLSMFFLLIFTISCYSRTCTYLNELLEDFKIYKTTCKHRGDLYEHSMWVEQYLSRWAKGLGRGSEADWIFPLMKKLSKREKEILSLGGLLHDVGKAGDPDCSKYETFYKKNELIYYFTKAQHERIGLEYVLHDVVDGQCYNRGYLKADGKTPYKFDILFKDLNLTKDEQYIIAVLIGGHRIFEGLYFDLEKKNDIEIYKKYRGKLQELLKEVDFTENEHWVDMMALVSMADLYATFFPLTEVGPSLALGEFHLCKVVHDFPGDAEFLKKSKDEWNVRGSDIVRKFKEVEAFVS